MEAKGKINNNRKNRNKKKIVLLVITVLLLVTGLGMLAYVGDYYHSVKGNEVYLESSETVKVSEVKEGLLFDGSVTDKALIFYPGGKVEYTAYAPIVRGLAENGIDCFLVKMPCNLAVFGMDKAEVIMERYGSYKDWYLAGHSLGGAMAASYVSDHLEDFAGLVLLAAYPTESLIPEADEVREDFFVLTVYGTEDKVINWDKLEEGYSFMPDNSCADVLAGGNHAQFGNYGEQDGDGIAAISAKEQWGYTVEAILEQVGKQ